MSRVDVMLKLTRTEESGVHPVLPPTVRMRVFTLERSVTESVSSKICRP